MTRVLVCGGRDFNDRAFVTKSLDRLHAAVEGPIDLLIHGAARGADSLGHYWAQARGVPVRMFPVDWEQYGKAAGSKRNQQMLDEGKPEFVVAFPGGCGTADMVTRAKAAGVPVWEPKP